VIIKIGSAQLTAHTLTKKISEKLMLYSLFVNINCQFEKINLSCTFVCLEKFPFSNLRITVFGQNSPKIF
jgi:hypothetical protein